MDISHGKLGKFKGTELTFENLACLHTVVSLRPCMANAARKNQRDRTHVRKSCLRTYSCFPHPYRQTAWTQIRLLL